MFGIALKDILGLSVLAAFVAALGALLGIFLKEYFFARSLERWKQGQALDLAYQKYRDPLLLGAEELASRISEILRHFPPNYLQQRVLRLRPARQVENSIEDEYFQRYKLVSTAYRFSAFFAWMELYRQEITFLHPGDHVRSKALEGAIEKIRSDVADGQINHAADWQAWRDTLIFREELRAIGESLIEAHGNVRGVMGYGNYSTLFDAHSKSVVKQWAAVGLNFLIELEDNGKDFRKIRLQRMYVHLVQLMLLLDKKSVTERLSSMYDHLRPNVADSELH